MHWAKMEAYLLDMDFFWDGVTDDLKGNLSLSKCQHYLMITVFLLKVLN